MAVAVRTPSRPGVMARLQESMYRLTGRAELAEQLYAERQMVAHLEESLTDLENRLFEPGWQQFVDLGNVEFSRTGLQQLTAICRLMAIKNPLIKRGLALRAAYVWGSGVTVRAGAKQGKASTGQQDVNQVVQDFLDANEATFSGATARHRHEHSLGTDGGVFFSLFTDPRTGAVKVRVLPYDDIKEIICDPQDRSARWYYKRQWVESTLNTTTGRLETEIRCAYYPDVTYRPRLRIPTIAGFPVYWDAPVVHVVVNAPEGWLFGVPDAYAAIDWAAAYQEFLEDWAKLVKALSRFAWKITAKGGKQGSIRQRLTTRPTRDPRTNEPLDTAATALTSPDMGLEAISKSGATIDAESGRPLAMMVASALGVPVTMLLSDPGQTGARAVAETLDQPTELEMTTRQSLWAEKIRQVLAYVIDASVRAPRGPLKGKIVRDVDTEIVTLTGDTDRSVNIDWPDLDDEPTETLIKAIALADQTGKVPPLVIARLLLVALGVDDVDAVLEAMTGEDGEFIPPDMSAGQAAMDAFRRGEDPAKALNGGGQDEQPPPGDGEATT